MRGKMSDPSGRRVETRLGSSRRAAGAAAITDSAAAQKAILIGRKKRPARKASPRKVQTSSPGCVGESARGIQAGVPAGSCGTEAWEEQEAGAMTSGTGEQERGSMEVPGAAGESPVAMEVAESALSEEPNMAAGPQVPATNSLGCQGRALQPGLCAAQPEGEGGERPQPEGITDFMHKMSVLERKEGDLKLRIELLAADLRLCNGGRRSEIIRELAFINKELEETEQEMGSTMGAIGPGQELCGNRESFQQMEQPHKPKPAMTFPFSQDAQQAVVSQTVTETAPCDLHQHTETLSLSGNGVNGSEFGVSGSGNGVNGSGFGENGSEFGVNGSGNGVNGSGNGVNGSEFGVNGSGNGVSGSGNGVNGSGNGVSGSGNGVNGSGFGENGSGNGVSGSGNGVSGSGNGVSGSEFGVSGSGNGVNGSGFGENGSGNGVSGSGNGVSGSGNGVSGSGFGVNGSGFGENGSEFGVNGSGNGVSGSGNGVSGSGNGVNETVGSRGGSKGDGFPGRGERGVHGGAGGTGGNVSYSDAVTNSDTRGAERALLPQTEVAEPGKRRNVVKIKWVQGREGFPGRRYVARRLIKETLGFTPDDVYALVTVTHTEFDLSFKLPQGLDEFWKGYERERGSDVWNGFEVIPVSKPEVKNVTIIFKSESINEEDVMFWLKRQCQVLSPLKRIYDEEGFWIGGWKVQVRLHSHLHVQKHLPNSLFLGKDRGVCFYVGQPRVCFKCGSNRHLAGKCTVQKCAFCGEVGHPSKDCVTIRCNLCLKLGHAHRDCPDAWHNVQKQCPNLLAELREGMGGEEGPETQGVAQRGTEGGTDLGNEGSISGKGVELTEREEQGAEKQDWRVVGGNSQKVNKRKAVPKEMAVETENRFDLLGKSWAAVMEEEEEVSVRLGKEREEEEVSVRLGKEREEEEEVSVRLGKEREEEEEVSVRLGKEREEEEEVSVRLGKEREEEEEVSVRLEKEGRRRKRFR
uniref:CCHC-type domain-containing protein n=1 Tax=Xenopus tropicalis TaxID=8364 RepID=A0A803KEC1_XENTR